MMLGRTVGHYRITDRLGEGGMGVVYRAEDVKLGRTVALKFLPPELTRNPEAMQRFEREARAASQLDHPNICTIHEFGEADDGQMYLAMACYDGESLEERIERGPVSLHEAIRIVKQIARGLGKAHASGIVHRDIKPANVIVTSDGVAKIVDFGLAKLAVATRITKTHTTVGTAAYMAPEQIRGEEIGPPADIWSLGVLLFELLTGELPFSGESIEALTRSILDDKPASVPSQPEVDRVIKRMLRKDPLQRYQTIDEVLRDLEPLESPGSGSSNLKRTRIKNPQLKSGAKFGPYRIVKPISSDVYLAKDTRLDREVAIKVLPADFSEDSERKERFTREAKAISQLTHPNICTLFDAGEQDGVDFLVMEFLEGETLAEKKTPLPIPQLLKIGTQIAEGLAAAHKQGIVHRDLKPSNVMITKSGMVKLLDFGLANDVGAYMAPEQIEGNDTDARTDIFALGAILYEILAGKRAFEAKTKATLIAAIVTTDPPPLTGVPPAIEHVIRKCLAKDRDERWQSVADIASELEWIKGSSMTSMTVMTPPLRRARRAMAAVLVIVAVLAAAAIAVAIGFGRRLEVAERTIRAELTLPPSTPLRGLGSGTIALSPDGSRLAMVLTTAGNAPGSGIAVRDFASGDVKLLAGTDGAIFPFWSADGKRIGFFANRKLKTISAEGGVVRVLCDVKLAVGGSWNRDGIIIFAADASTGPIFKTSEAGGTPVAVTKVAQGWVHGNPSFLPDGRTFLFTGHNGAMSVGNLYAGSIDGREQKLVTENASNAAVVGDRVIFVRNRNVVAQKFDAKTLTTTGTPADIAEDVTVYNPKDLAIFSAAANTIAYVPRVVNPAQIGLFDRAGHLVEQKGEPADYHILDVSPDGKQVAVSMGEELTSSDVWLIQLESGTRSRVTFMSGNQPSAVFSPDGSRLATCANGPRGRARIVIHSLSGGAAEEIVDSPDWMFITGWSADGNILVGSFDLEHLFYVHIRERKIEMIKTPVEAFMPAVSPNGKWLAYTSFEAGVPQVHVTEFPQALGKWQVSEDGGYDPRWSRDGKQLFFKSGGKVSVTDIREGGVPQFGIPVSLPVEVDPVYMSVGYAILQDGRIASLTHAGSAPARTIHVITNWTKLLP